MLFRIINCWSIADLFFLILFYLAEKSMAINLNWSKILDWWTFCLNFKPHFLPDRPNNRKWSSKMIGNRECKTKKLNDQFDELELPNWSFRDPSIPDGTSASMKWFSATFNLKASRRCITNRLRSNRRTWFFTEELPMENGFRSESFFLLLKATDW